MKYLALILVIFVISHLKIQGAQQPIALANNIPAINAAADPQGIFNAYTTNLLPRFSNLGNLGGNMLADALAIDSFNARFFLPRAINLPTQADSQNFLNALRAAHNDISNFIYNQPNPHLGIHLQHGLLDTLNAVFNRYSLAKIEDKAINGDGYIGQNALQGIPAAFRTTIQLLTGRIFVVKAIPNAPPQIISSSSGMIVPRAIAGGVLYDQILTCCHSMAVEPTSPNLEFYFVRSEYLNPQTGLPRSTVINMALAVPANSLVNTQSFIAYLRTKGNNPSLNNQVRRITHFNALGKFTSDLANHSPKYVPEVDCGYGFLNAGFNFAAHINFAQVQTYSGIPAGNYTYYALGYAAFSYYDTTNFSPLSQQLKLAPLTITRSQSQVPNPNAAGLLLGVYNGFIHHGATSTNGMSGGPLFDCDLAGNRIRVFGVLSIGNMNYSYACQL